MTAIGRAALGALAMLALLGRGAIAAGPADYVGARVCAGCHAAEFAAWQTSHHALAMQKTSPTSVFGDFSGATFTQDSTATVFSRDPDGFRVRTEGPDGRIHDYPVAYTFGVHPLQQYLIPFPGGRYQMFGIAWDSRTRAEGGQRWYALYPDHPPRPGDPLHWTGRDQTWNYQCAACHSTDLRKNFDLAADSYATAFSDVSVACEACHGPGSGHVTWAQARSAGGALPDDLRKGLVAWLRASDRGTWEMDPATGIAHRTVPPDSASVLDACGGCHARRSVIAPTHDAATPFLDAYRPALLQARLYHADGQIDGEVFEFGSFVQSRMFRAGVTCTNCHDPHAGGRIAQGNALCAQCHMPQRFDVTEHHHHTPGSPGAQCANCHMPAKTYMGIDRRRDHSFRVPRPDLTLRIGTPNTCAECHADKPAAWAAEALAAWFPNGRQTRPHYGIALNAGRTGAADAEVLLDSLVRDPTAPGIARATALTLLAAYATAASDPVIAAAVADPDPLVRMAAPSALSATAAPATVRAMLPLLADPLRAVRIQAARALAGVDPREMTRAQTQALAAASQELDAAERIDADRPEAHLNLGLLAVQRGDPAQAEAEYRTALRLAPRFVPALVNLADLDRMRGQDADAGALLRRAVTLEPANAEARHALGLLLVRARDYAGALEQLRRAMALAPQNARYAYVYAVALNATGAPQQARDILERTHAEHPADREVLTALVSLAQAAGDTEGALRHARELAALDPSDSNVQALVRDLGRR